MKSDLQQYCLRLPRAVYADAVDVAGLFGISMNQLLLVAVREYVDSQLRQEMTRSAIDKVREARQALGSQLR